MRAHAKFGIIPLVLLVVLDELVKELHRVGVNDPGQVGHGEPPQKCFQGGANSLG